MRILADGKEILNSGVVSSFGMNDLEFEVSKEHSLFLIFHVEGKMEEKEGSIDVVAADGNKRKVIAKNPHVFDNFGPGDPLEICQINGKSIFMSFRVNVLGDYGSYFISYTFYKEL